MSGAAKHPKGYAHEPLRRRPIKLLIVDNHPVVRDGLSSMFARDPGFEVLGGRSTAPTRSSWRRRCGRTWS